MANNRVVRVGRLLYRYRAVIAAPFFIVLFVFSRPHHSPCVLASLLILTGLLIRIWAAGYIGRWSRKNEFQAEFIITNGPYRLIKHPLYAGNFLIVVGVVLLFNAPLWLSMLLISLFIVEYSTIIYSETHFIKGLTGNVARFRWINAKGEISTVFIVCVVYLIYFGRLFFMSAHTP